jgi:hypothetical protein
MTPSEAEALFNLMRANYVDARAKVDEDTVALWLTELRRLDRQLGDNAVRSLLKGCRFWPTLAELEDAVEVARDQAVRTRREAARRDEQRAFDELELPPLREIPEAVALLERLRLTPPSLERVVDGPCRDCGKVGSRFRIGRVDVCIEHARSRMRVAGRNGGATA